MGADFRVTYYARIDVLAVTRSLQGQRVLDGEQPRAPDCAQRCAMRADFTRRDIDDICPKLSEFGQHELVDAFAYGGQQDDCCNPDSYARRG